jgi:hypothetical protein
VPPCGIHLRQRHRHDHPQQQHSSAQAPPQPRQRQPRQPSIENDQSSQGTSVYRPPFQPSNQPDTSSVRKPHGDGSLHPVSNGKRRCWPWPLRPVRP